MLSTQSGIGALRVNALSADFSASTAGCTEGGAADCAYAAEIAAKPKQTIKQRNKKILETAAT